ncbi:MAG: hypothetical protein ACFFA4_05870 [Promethearchaeota archaeon]
MSVLSEDELEKLKISSLKRWLFRLIYLIFGSSLILLGILFTTSQIDFGIRINGINLSLMIYILIIVIGMVITWKFIFPPYYLRRESSIRIDSSNFRESLENSIKFNSFSISRLIAALTFISVGIISIIISTQNTINQINYAGFFILGENTFFYAIGLPAFGIGISLFIYLILSPFRGIFTQSQNSYFFLEYRPLFPWIHEIPKNQIDTIKYQNNYLGRKLSWILLLVPLIGFQLITAISIFIDPINVSELYISWFLIICSILEIFGLILLIFFTQDFYEIITADLLYYMWFSPIQGKKRFQFTKNFSEFLGCELKKYEKDDTLFSKVSNRHFQMFALIFGLFLIIRTTFINTELFLLGPLLFWITLLYGIILLAKALNYNFSNRGGDTFHYDDNSKIFRFQRKFKFKFQYITHNKVGSVSVKKQFRKLELLDISLIGWILILTIAYQIEEWIVLDAHVFLLSNIISTIFLIIEFAFIFLYVCFPIDQIEIITLHAVYRIEITRKREGKSIFNKYIYNFMNFPKEVLSKKLKKTFIFRITVIILIILISVISTYGILTTYLL